MTRSVFDPVAERYDASRPGYPDGLFDAIEEKAGPLRGATGVEVGAGTGKGTRGLLARGAQVLAVDIGADMLARLRSRSPDVAAVVGDGVALPLGNRCADLFAAAQSYHWLPLDRSLPEAIRVLRPGRPLALWWNVTDATATPWRRAQDELFQVTPSGAPGQKWPDGIGPPLHASGLVDRVEHAEIRWEWRVPIGGYLGYIGSKSAVVRLGAGTDDFLAEQRQELQEDFPDGVVVEPFTCRLTLAWPR